MVASLGQSEYPQGSLGIWREGALVGTHVSECWGFAQLIGRSLPSLAKRKAATLLCCMRLEIR